MHVDRDTAAELTEALLAASRALVGVAARSLGDADEVTLPQYRALVVLAGSPGMRTGELAGLLDIQPSTATRLCDRLVRKGLIERAQAEADRRETTLTLSPTGRRLVRRVIASRRRDVAAIVRRMPADQAEAGIAALSAFAEAAGEPTGIDLFGWGATEGGSGPGPRS
jgi:DNA-binding MarR family transcriptional regulator